LEQAVTDIQLVKQAKTEASQQEKSVQQSSRESVAAAVRDLDQTQLCQREMQSLVQKASAQLTQERLEIHALEATLQDYIHERTRKAEQQKMRMQARAYWDGELMATM
jgi:hypothetical protein